MPEDTKPLIVGIPQETFAGERRVALVPADVQKISNAGLQVVIEAGAGLQAGFSDDDYQAQGAQIADRDQVFQQADVILQVRTAGANVAAGQADLQRLRAGQYLIGMCDPLSQPQLMVTIAEKQCICFALELLPRITRAQSMDVLSSMATVAGYKAVLLAAETLPRMFPMMMTAAGTITPAKVLIVGAGVAGLQAISCARRLGAVVSGYDIREAVKQEVMSLGAKFVELELETQEAGQSGGYAQAKDEDFYRRQRELMSKVVADSDVVITTAAVPGKQAPVLVTAEMVSHMRPGSVIVDLAAEQGGNCELTKPNETVVHNKVSILGCVNLPSTIPFHASQMFSKNVTTFLLYLAKDQAITLNREDEIVRDTLVTFGGEVVQPRVREMLGLEEVAANTNTPAPATDAPGGDTSETSAETQPASDADNAAIANRESSEETPDA